MAKETESGSAVFLISGRDREARAEFTRLLNAYGIEVITWEKAIQLSGNPAAHAREVVEVGMRSADAVVVLLTGDDEARLRSELCPPEDKPYEGSLRPQPRPNVFFEAGLALAIHPRKTIFAQIGRLRGFSDIDGIQRVPLDESAASLQSLENRLKLAGCRLSHPADEAMSRFRPPGSEKGLPRVQAVDGEFRGSITLLRRFKSLLSWIPSMGGNVTVVQEAKIGEKLSLSIRRPEGIEVSRIDHWVPGATKAVVLPKPSDAGVSQIFEIAIEMPGPAGIHLFDAYGQTVEGGLSLFARHACAVLE